MKCSLANLADGSQWHESALVAALRDGTIAGAGLDVFAREPDIDPALRALDNVVLMPHAASAARKTRPDLVAPVPELSLSHFCTCLRIARVRTRRLTVLSLTHSSHRQSHN